MSDSFPFSEEGGRKKFHLQPGSHIHFHNTVITSLDLLGVYDRSPARTLQVIQKHK